MKLDQDAVLWSAPERERAGRPLLVLLHGYGSHEGDLFSLSPGLPLGPVVASLRAPIAEGPGYSWFTMDPDEPDDVRVRAADEGAIAVLDWLGTTESTSVGLLGFSQGGALALQLLRLAPERFDFTVMLSGFVVDAPHPGDEVLESLRPPVFWGRGTADGVIPGSNIDSTAEWLGSHTTVQTEVYEGLDHSIANRELHDINAFIREHLK